ncbi:testis-expressed protein 36 isoform X2 [Hippocampus zosterae]|uniref:testis-expressed protein 36 isoform X2 n=1 Tax=Hippocampus zosterae TaxID=109293 RepID=UPI00223DB6D6|nr:testis-expressed protein 36 isoform X2 [Hippocampus zosterae]
MQFAIYLQQACLISIISSSRWSTESTYHLKLLCQTVSMVKGGKRYSPMSNDGNWFPHPDAAPSEGRNRELSTSTGRMLTQIPAQLPQAFDFERFTKTRPGPGAGRKKCPKEINQHKSHFCLCQHGIPPTTVRNSVYGADFASQPTVEPTRARRFARDHKRKCAQAPLDGGDFMWFGQDTYDDYDSMEVLGFANLNAGSRPL